MSKRPKVPCRIYSDFYPDSGDLLKFKFKIIILVYHPKSYGIPHFSYAIILKAWTLTNNQCQNRFYKVLWVPEISLSGIFENVKFKFKIIILVYHTKSYGIPYFSYAIILKSWTLTNLKKIRIDSTKCFGSWGFLKFLACHFRICVSFVKSNNNICV